MRRRRRDVIVASSSNGRDGTVAAETRAKALRRLLASPGLHQGPACYDALSAKLVEMAGFSFSFMSGQLSLPCLSFFQRICMELSLILQQQACQFMLKKSGIFCKLENDDNVLG